MKIRDLEGILPKTQIVRISTIKALGEPIEFQLLCKKLLDMSFKWMYTVKGDIPMGYLGAVPIVIAV